MSGSCGVIVIFLIYGQFGAMRKPDFERIVFKTYFFINTNMIVLLWIKVLFLSKNADFLQKKMLTSAKLREPGDEKAYFVKIHIDVYLRTKFQVSIKILTSFRQGEVWGEFYPIPPQNKPPKSQPRLGLIIFLEIPSHICHFITVTKITGDTAIIG